MARTLLHCELRDYSLEQIAFAVFERYCELRDYSLEQIAFAVFQALFAITQLLCHVSALLTCACKQA